LSTNNHQEQMLEMGIKFCQWWFEILLAISADAVNKENLADQFWIDGIK
jgi:hypothetical protein